MEKTEQRQAFEQGDIHLIRVSHRANFTHVSRSPLVALTEKNWLMTNG